MPLIIGRSGGGGGAGGAPSGPAGGDLDGTYPNPTLAAGAVLFDAYALLQHQETAGTNGGTFTQGAWQTRPLTTEVFDPSAIVSLAANQFTLAAGSYYIQAWATAVNVNGHQARIRNITAGSTLAAGETTTAPGGGGSQALVYARAVIAGATAFELQHQCQATSANLGFGQGLAFGEVNVYAQVLIYREVS